MNKVMPTFLATFSMLFCLNALAEDLRPVTHEEVWLMNRLGTPVVSPDGKKAVVSMTEPSYKADETVSDLWLLDVSGETDPLRLTSSSEGESDVVWSPDGSKIAFGAKREEEEPAQIYVLNMVGPGEAVRITDLSTGAGKPNWSPDGKRIAFESRVYPGAADDAANAAKRKPGRSVTTMSQLTRPSPSGNGTAGAMTCRHSCLSRMHSRGQRRKTCCTAVTSLLLRALAAYRRYPPIH